MQSTRVVMVRRISFLGLLLGLLLHAHCSLAIQDGHLRLIGGTQSNEGRVEVYYSGEWGTICDDSWQIQDADVICKQLGFEGAKEIYYRALFGEGDGPIWIDQINCPTSASSILECEHNGWGVNDCKHSEDAGVTCSRPEPANKPESLPVRLSCPINNPDGSCKACPDTRYLRAPEDCADFPLFVVAEGIVEVYYNGKWTPVSGEQWDISDARVVCGELGYPFSYGIPSLDDLWPSVTDSNSSCAEGSTPCEDNSEDIALRARLEQTLLNTLDCSGTESKLIDCYFPDLNLHPNPLLNIATVRCGSSNPPECYPESGTEAEKYRLRSGPMPWMGRVEARLNGEWGTICDVGWDLQEANIVCRSLGFGTAKSVFPRAKFGRGVGKIHFTDLRCTGSEGKLSSCTGGSADAAQACGHQGDAGIICNAPSASCFSPSTRFHEESDPLNPQIVNSFLEYNHEAFGWGAICYTPSFDFFAAHAACRESKEQFAAKIQKGDISQNYAGNFYTAEIKCNSTDISFRDCDVEIGVTIGGCADGEIIIVCTSHLPDLVPNLKSFRESLLNYPHIDRSPMYYLQCSYEEGCLSSSAVGQPQDHLRTLLRFNSLTFNEGTANFLPNLQPHQWLWHSCHEHYHSFEAFIHYDLLDMNTHEKVAEGHKASFCLEDSECGLGANNPDLYRCGTGVQGISVGCGDLYARHLDCQWIDITDVPGGYYVLRQIVNLDRLTPESDYLNNMIYCEILYYQNQFIYPYVCGLSDH